MEEHSTTLITDVKPKFEIQGIAAQEHYATTITQDLHPKYQPVDLTISVPIPPKFLQPLKNITAMEGTKVTFEGVVTGMNYVLAPYSVKRAINASLDSGQPAEVDLGRN